MKLSNVALAALAAAAQASPEPQRDVASDVEGAVSQAATYIDSVATPLAKAYSDNQSEGNQILSDASKFLATRTGDIGSDLAHLTSEAIAQASSINQRIATETDPAVRSRVSAELSKVSDAVARATSNVPSRATGTAGSTGGAGAAPTAAVAVGALMGGAAMFANF